MHAVAFLAALVALAGSPGQAPSPHEQRLFDNGMRAFLSGEPQAAEKAWEAGYVLGHDPAFLVHIGDAQEKLGAPARAAASYRRYLQQVPDASDRSDIEHRLARLAPAIPTPAAAPAPAESPGDFGAPAVARSVSAATPSPAASPRADAEGPTAQEANNERRDPAWSRSNVTAVVATAATVAMLGTAGFFAAAAGSHRDDINRLVLFHNPTTGAPLPYSGVAAQYTQAMTDGQRDDRDAKIALIGAAGSAAVAALFFLLDATFTQRPSVSIAPAAAGLAAVGGWTWSW